MSFRILKKILLKCMVVFLCQLLAGTAFAAEPLADLESMMELMKTGVTDYQFKNSEDKAQAFLHVVLENKIAPVKRMISDGYDVDINTRDKLSVLGAAYSFAELNGRPDFAMINLLEANAKNKCDGSRKTFGKDSPTSRITISELIAKSKNSDFLKGLKSARCPYK